MLIAVGFALVFGSVIGGYLSVGGYLGALYQPAEFVIIFGAGVGSFVAATRGTGIKSTVKALLRLLRGSSYRKAVCVDLITLLYLLLAKGREAGMMALEADIDNPQDSALFSQYPNLLQDAIVMEFITDYLRLMISGSMDAFEIESLMDHEIETFQQEAEAPAQALFTMADSLPAFGIVAAVMGVVHALGEVALDPAGIGPLIAKAMVGTFLGILLAYGFVMPMASRVQSQAEDTVKILQSIKVTLLASLNGYAPPLAIEFGRKALYSTERPTFGELDEHVREVRANAAAGASRQQ